MVDVGEKTVTRRRAGASALVRMAPETREAVAGGNLPKGDVFNTARIAGILASKRVHELIPLTHALALVTSRCFSRPSRKGSGCGPRRLSKGGPGWKWRR